MCAVPLALREPRGVAADEAGHGLAQLIDGVVQLCPQALVFEGADPTLGAAVGLRLRQRSWETPEGDERSATEIEADEVGASLKWATAKVERASQCGNGDRSSGRERQGERGGDFNDAPPTY